jgi:hypothetical protein
LIRVQNPTPEIIGNVLNLSEVFDAVVTSSQVRVQAPRYFGSTTHALELVSASYADAIEVSA